MFLHIAVLAKEFTFQTIYTSTNTVVLIFSKLGIQLEGEDETMAKKIALPCEFKYDYAMSGYTFVLKAWLHVIRREYGAATALKLYEETCKIGDRTKKLTNLILTIFKLEGNDAETIGEWWEIWWECCGGEITTLERSKTINRIRITKCPWKTEPKDIGDWCVIWSNIITKTINPKATFERPKGMCAGDPYCESIVKVEE